MAVTCSDGVTSTRISSGTFVPWYLFHPVALVCQNASFTSVGWFRRNGPPLGNFAHLGSVRSPKIARDPPRSTTFGFGSFSQNVRARPLRLRGFGLPNVARFASIIPSTLPTGVASQIIFAIHSFCSQ